MPEITINGRSESVAAGTTVLEAARKLGIFIPTLCYHPGLGPYGACRLCLVEVKAGFRPGLMSSCGLPAMEGLVVETDSPLVKEGRRLVAELLLARAPESKEIQTLARSMGVESTNLPRKDELCILCGRCVRACHALGIDAISFTHRGPERCVATPFDKPSETCMACQSCVTVCPTGAIRAKIIPDAIDIEPWQNHQPLVRCGKCGKHFATMGQQARVENLLPDGHQLRGNLCAQCRRMNTADDMTSFPRAEYSTFGI